MLKNNDVIAKLTDSQKVRILTGVGSLSGKDFKILGLDGVKACNMKDYCRDAIPHAAILSHSWDEELWREVAKVKAQRIAKDGADLAIVPGAKIKISPYRREITEDPLLASRFSAAHSGACKEIGLRTALSGYYLTESDVDWMDDEPSDRVINEFVVRPYANAMDMGCAYALMTDVRPVAEEYENSCRSMQDVVSYGKHLFCESATEENTVDFIARGIICLSASANALEAAMARYKKLKAAYERGDGITPQQIQNEEISRTAISDEDVDKALDEVIEFIKQRGEYDLSEEIDENDVAYRATVDSTVLLKNTNRTLPLKKDRRIALIGGILPDDENGENLIWQYKNELEARGYSCVGAEPGYDPEQMQQNYMMERAVRLTHAASVVILFLGFGYENEKRISSSEILDIPANQLRIADALVKKGKTVIGVIAAGHAPDIAFTRGFKALLMAPLDVASSVKAITSVLTGEVSPSGKLAYTLYAGSRVAFRKRALYKSRYSLKSGPFIGYRYYDTAELKLGYPFGHGLSYSEFVYSDLSCAEGAVSFTVENVGEMTAAEVAQIYIGCTRDTVLRPKKELCGFTKIRLAPLEKKRVTIPISIPGVYQDGSFKVENGEYDLFVGSSVSDIRLSTRLNVQGAVLLNDGEKLKNYIQSVTNVIEDNFTLEANYSPMNKKSFKNILSGLASLALAISVAVFNTATEISSVFLGCVAGILAVFAMAFFVMEILERSRNYEDDRARINEKNKEYFSDAEQLPVFSTDKMFNEEFDASSEDAVEDLLNVDDTIDKELSEYIDADFKLVNLAKELSTFCEEKGMRLDSGVAENLAVSLAGSKLLVLDGIKSEDFNSLMIILSEYFATKTYVDRIDKKLKGGNDIFFSSDNHGDSIKRASVLAIEDSAMAEDKIHILGVDGVDANSFEKLVKPFVNYLSSSKERSAVQIFNDQGVNVGYSVVRNLKLIVRLDENTAVDMLPVALLRSASFSTVSFVKCKPKSAWSSHHGCNRYQLEYIFEKESSATVVSEQIYKKVDKLESYVASHSDYHIGNKLWLAFEKQIGLFLSTKAQIDDATDAAVATKLLPSMSAALCGKLTKEDETLKGTIEFVFGEENITFSSKFINLAQEKHARAAEAEAKNNAEAKAKTQANTNVKSGANNVGEYEIVENDSYGAGYVVEDNADEVLVDELEDVVVPEMEEEEV